MFGEGFTYMLGQLVALALIGGVVWFAARYWYRRKIRRLTDPLTGVAQRARDGVTAAATAAQERIPAAVGEAQRLTRGVYGASRQRADGLMARLRARAPSKDE